jgi:hypothetical protein
MQRKAVNPVQLNVYRRLERANHRQDLANSTNGMGNPNDRIPGPNMSPKMTEKFPTFAKVPLPFTPFYCPISPNPYKTHFFEAKR